MSSSDVGSNDGNVDAWILKSTGFKSIDRVCDSAGHLDRRWTVVSGCVPQILHLGSSL